MVEYANEGFRQCEVIVDTGFTGWLTLPEAVSRELGLVSAGQQQFTLATGAVEQSDYYETRVAWRGELRWVEVFPSMDQSLLGMELLRDSWIGMGAWDGGDVIIEQPQQP